MVSIPKWTGAGRAPHRRVVQIFCCVYGKALWVGVAIAAVATSVGCDGLLETATSNSSTAQSANTSAGAAPPLSTLSAREPDKIRIASYNIQVFGISKESKPQVMNVLAEVIRQFDVVAIQEIRATDQGLIERFVSLVNSGGRAYHYVLGPRLGRTSSKEQYAYVYDTTRLTLDTRSVHTVDDPDDLVHRPPFIARFVYNQLPVGEGFSFTLINMHTDPDEAEDEVNVLDDVFLSARADGRYEEDVILLGDLNVDHKRLGQLGGVPGIHCTVHGQPTNILRTKSYDNIVFDPTATAEYTGRAGVLDVQQAFGLSDAVAKQVSDHNPVWAEFSVYEQRATTLAARPR